MALGSTDDHRKLRIFENTALSSFLEPDPAAVKAWDFMSEADDRIEVPVRRLDGFLPEVAPAAVFARSFLKIDTQGWDSEVLRGSERLIRHVMMLQTELSFKPLYNDQPSYSEVLPQIEVMGFEMAALFPVVRDHNYSLIEADCVMVRREQILEDKSRVLREDAEPSASGDPPE